jgi:hypothetical protein
MLSMVAICRTKDVEIDPEGKFKCYDSNCRQVFLNILAPTLFYFEIT